jgi:heme A synthase
MKHRIERNLLLIVATLLVLLLVVVGSFTMLPAAPIAPTPTWPLGIDLPDKLHRISPP